MENQMPDEDREAGHSIEMSGDLDRQTAEVLHLEIRRLAKRYGLEVKALMVDRRKDRSS